MCGVSFSSLLVLFLFAAGCTKEYSYEQKPRDTVAVGNSTPPVVTNCNACTASSLPDSSWRVTIDGVIYCGVADKAIITLERTSFTFFGPSFCSADSGFVATVYLDEEKLNRDRTNVPAKTAVYYYDRVAPSTVYMSAAAQPLSMTITEYTHRTGIATGVFSGFVLDQNSIRRELKHGKFRIQL